MILDIGEWALRATAQFAAQMNQARLEPLVFSANVSQLQFRCRDMIKLVGHVLQETGISPSWLILEMIESQIIENISEMADTLRQLQAMGVGISIDDFGSGYTSLRYLDRLPISEIKIDRSFISDIHLHRSKSAIVKAIINIAKDLGISVIAEGVEQDDEISMLLDLGCVNAQGYYFGLPYAAIHSKPRWRRQSPSPWTGPKAGFQRTNVLWWGQGAKPLA